MTYIRNDLWTLADQQRWHPTLLWYAKAIQHLLTLQPKEPTSWRFLAAMHGFDKDLWSRDGYLSGDAQLPGKEEQDLYWNQCQHQSWYFLPWHRGYLLSFESIVRDTVAKLGGPRDWTLPYWNYDDYDSRPQVLGLPPEFYDAWLPDGSANPLALPNLRFGTRGDGKIQLSPPRISVECLGFRDFIGAAQGGAKGFGGPKTGFHNYGEVSGGLESSPHNHVHIDVGGEHLDVEGLMSDPNTAGLDPIFWLHHANIDRLWQVWLDRDPNHSNPSEPDFVDGPPPGGRQFIVPQPNSEQRSFKVADMLDLAKLGYTYQNLTDPLAKRRLFAQAPLAPVPEQAPLNKTERVELIGANALQLQLRGRAVQSEVKLDTTGIGKVSKSLAAKRSLFAADLDAPRPATDRVFLNLENIRGNSNVVTLDVYVDLPPGADPSQHQDLRAGSVALFGVRQASRSDGAHAGAGLSDTLEITAIVDRLSQGGAVDLQKLHVTVVASKELRDKDDISIGRISIYRQGA